jgi:hypothetical protein
MQPFLKRYTMEQSPSSTSRTFAGIIALAGWFAITFQLYLIVLNRVTSVPEAVIRFFSFFTILSNILLAVCASTIFIKRQPESGFFQRSTNITAITVYMTIVGLIYNLILRYLWAPQGLQRIVDELLHLIMPVLSIIYWFLFVSKKELKWNHMWGWLLYPLVYIIYTLIRGSIWGFYPYPFIDVNKLGYMQVLINSLGITVLFLFFSLLFIGIGRKLARSPS